jgi:hypothetical protein
MKLLVLSNGEEVIVTTPDKKATLKEDWPGRNFEDDYSEVIHEGAFSFISGGIRLDEHTKAKVIRH